MDVKYYIKINLTYTFQMITDPCGNSFPVSRRNTITIGEDHSLVSGTNYSFDIYNVKPV